LILSTLSYYYISILLLYIIERLISQLSHWGGSSSLAIRNQWVRGECRRRFMVISFFSSNLRFCHLNIMFWIWFNLVFCCFRRFWDFSIDLTLGKGNYTKHHWPKSRGSNTNKYYEITTKKLLNTLTKHKRNSLVTDGIPYSFSHSYNILDQNLINLYAKNFRSNMSEDTCWTLCWPYGKL